MCTFRTNFVHNFVSTPERFYFMEFLKSDEVCLHAGFYIYINIYIYPSSDVCECVQTSVAVLAEIPLRSPQNLFIFII